MVEAVLAPARRPSAARSQVQFPQRRPGPASVSATVALVSRPVRCEPLSGEDGWQLIGYSVGLMFSLQMAARYHFSFSMFLDVNASCLP